MLAGPEHPLTYRQEIAAQVSEKFGTGESRVVVGPASMGKSRLLRGNVQAHYLRDRAATTWLGLVDCDRLVRFGFISSSSFQHDRKCV